MQVSPCRPYHSRTIGHTLVRMAKGRSLFKTYFVNIIGRPERTRYEWPEDKPFAPAVESRLADLSVEGVGFIIAFPHITKVFRFAPTMETVLHVQGFNTPDMSPLDLRRNDGFVEFACYAEAAIAADEYHMWARAETVEEYLETFSAFVDGPIVSHAKLAEFWG